MDYAGHIDSILIHGGAGALGQALISIALTMGSEVFTTVSDVSKKRFLIRLFPQLKGKSINYKLTEVKIFIIYMISLKISCEH